MEKESSILYTMQSHWSKLIYSQQEKQISWTLLTEHSYFDNVPLSHTLTFYTTGTGYTLPPQQKWKKIIQIYPLYLKTSFSSSFSLDTLLCDTSMYYTTASIPIKEIFTYFSKVCMTNYVTMNRNNSFKRVLCLLLSMQNSIKKKKTYYFIGVIKASFRNNSKTRMGKHFLWGYTISRLETSRLITINKRGK